MSVFKTWMTQTPEWLCRRSLRVWRAASHFRATLKLCKKELQTALWMLQVNFIDQKMTVFCISASNLLSKWFFKKVIMPNFKGAECETVKISSCSCTLAELSVLCLYSRLLVSWLYTDAVTGVAGIDGCQSMRMALKGIRGGWGRGVKGNPGCKLRSEFNEREKKDYSSHQATVYELERYLLSSVPNQVLNSPSSQLNDACNRTRLQHGADRTTEKPEGHLDIFSAARLTFTKRPESSFPLPSFFFKN